MEGKCFNRCSWEFLTTTSPVSKEFDMGDDKPKHSNIGASFIKVLDHDFSKQLEMPQEFIANFNGYRPHRFIIESATTKKCWRVEVEEDGEGRLYFRDGWGEFVEAHLLEVGNILVFEYEEQSIFQVKIYGRNGCEKTTVADAKLGCHRNLQETFVIEDDGESESSEQENERVPPTKNKNIVYTENVPVAVSVRKNLSSKRKVDLRNAKGNCWPVKINHDRSGRAIFGQGWKDFLDGNEIGPGDTLKLEFTSDDLIQVHVTRASKVEQHDEEAKYQNEASGSSLDMNCSAGRADEPVTCTADDKETEASITRKGVSSELTSSSFSFLWKPNTTGTFLYIPKAVGQRLKNKDSIVIRDPEGKCWPLEVRKRYDGRVALTKGWSEFWKGHGITAGDSLLFEFVSDFLIQVTINRSNPVDYAIEGAPKATGNEGAVTQLEMVDN